MLFRSVIVILFSQNAKKPHARIISVKLAKFDKGEKSDYTSARRDYKRDLNFFFFGAQAHRGEEKREDSERETEERGKKNDA